MNEEILVGDVYTLTDEETGEEMDYEVIGAADIDEQFYVALVPANEEVEEYIILRVEEDEETLRKTAALKIIVFVIAFWVVVIGIIITAVLVSKKVKNSYLLSIISTTIIGLFLGVTTLPDFAHYSVIPSIKPTFLQIGMTLFAKQSYQN